MRTLSMSTRLGASDAFHRVTRVLLVASVAPAALASQATPEPIRAAVNCYSAKLAGVESADLARTFDWIPERFQLKSKTVQPDWSADKPARTELTRWRAAVVKPRTPPRSRARAEEWAWRMPARDSIQLFSGDGFYWLDLTLHLAADSLRGTAWFESDVRGSARSVRVVGWRIPCDAPGTRGQGR